MPEQEFIRLTDYLIELSHDYAKLKAFWTGRADTVNSDSRLRPEHRDALIRGDLSVIQGILNEENAGDGDDAGFSGGPALLILSPLRPIN